MQLRSSFLLSSVYSPKMALISNSIWLHELQNYNLHVQCKEMRSIINNGEHCKCSSFNLTGPSSQ